MLDVLKLKRSDTFVKRKCKKVGRKLVANADISVFVPSSLEKNNLLFLDERLYTVGSIMYVSGNEYANMNLACTIELGVTEYARVNMLGHDGEETECYEFVYTKGDVIHPTNLVPIDAGMAYDLTNHHVLRGKTVPFFDEVDIDNIFDSMPRFCNFGLPEYGYLNHFPEMIKRDANNTKVPFRLSKSKKMAVIPFSSVIHNVASVIGMNMGGYPEDGLQVAITTKSTTTTTFEKVTRS